MPAHVSKTPKRDAISYTRVYKKKTLKKRGRKGKEMLVCFFFSPKDKPPTRHNFSKRERNINNKW